jgi:hypothetical protein
MMRGLGLEGIEMATTSQWDAQGEAQAALRTIVADPRYGPATLSNAQTMTNLLKDMLPDAPRESSVLVAASDAGVAGILQTHMSNGMDLATASRLAAGSFENQTALTPEACSWAVGAFASALRLDVIRQAPPPPPVRDTVSPVANGQPTVKAPAAGVGTGFVVTAGPPGGGQPKGLRIASAVLVGAAAFLLVWSCALSFVRSSGGDEASFFSVAGAEHTGTWWFAIVPIVVAVLAIVAAIVLLITRSELTRGLTAGLFIAFGVSMLLVYAVFAFTEGPDNHPGPAEAVGAVGAVLLLAAGVLALVGRKRPAA